MVGVFTVSETCDWAGIESREVLYEEESYYRELAHTIMEAEKSHDLPSASWRPRKVLFRSESKSLRSRGTNDVNSSLGAKDQCPSSAGSQEAKGQFLLPPPFVLFRL